MFGFDNRNIEFLKLFGEKNGKNVLAYNFKMHLKKSYGRSYPLLRYFLFRPHRQNLYTRCGHVVKALLFVSTAFIFIMIFESIAYTL